MLRMTTNRRRLASCGAALCLIIILLALGLSGGEQTGLEVRILDVGQGDAILIRASGGQMLLDAGPNAAEESLRSELAVLGVRTLDVVLFTHPDEDHIGGGDMILREFSVKHIIFPPADSSEPSYLRLLAAAAESGAELHIGEAGARFTLGDADVTLLGPIAAYDDVNNGSIVVRIDYGETAVLLMGDAEAEAEADLLVAVPELLGADLLKLGHHGAKTSTSAALLDAVAPQFAAVSCGKNNSYGHPARRVIDALNERGIEIGRTDREGTLVYCSDGTTMWRKK